MNLFLRILNWIWFWETWSWYLGSIWNLNHGILLGHGCIMDELFGIWFLETHTIFENLNLHKLILDFEGNEQQENWRTWIKHYNKKMRSVKIERHNKNITTRKWEAGKLKDTTLQQQNKKWKNGRTQKQITRKWEAGKWKDAINITNKEMKSRKMEGHKRYQYSATKALVLQPKPSNRIKNLSHIPKVRHEKEEVHMRCVS